MRERTPEKIYGWQNTQLSIAKYAGGCSYNGAQYVIAYEEHDQPLVRMDLLRQKHKNPATEQAVVNRRKQGNS